MYVCVKIPDPSPMNIFAKSNSRLTSVWVILTGESEVAQLYEQNFTGRDTLSPGTTWCEQNANSGRVRLGSLLLLLSTVSSILW